MESRKVVIVVPVGVGMCGIGAQVTFIRVRTAGITLGDLQGEPIK